MPKGKGKAQQEADFLCRQKLRDQLSRNCSKALISNWFEGVVMIGYYSSPHPKKAINLHSDKVWSYHKSYCEQQLISIVIGVILRPSHAQRRKLKLYDQSYVCHLYSHFARNKKAATIACRILSNSWGLSLPRHQMFSHRLGCCLSLAMLLSLPGSLS